MLIKEIFRPAEQFQRSIALYADTVKAGFPSPAQDYIEQTLSLDDLCIRTPAATFFVRASGSSMEKPAFMTGMCWSLIAASLPDTGRSSLPLSTGSLYANDSI